MKITIKASEIDDQGSYRVVMSAEHVTDDFLLEAAAALALTVSNHTWEDVTVPITLDDSQVHAVATQLVLMDIRRRMADIQRNHTLMIQEAE